MEDFCKAGLVLGLGQGSEDGGVKMIKKLHGLKFDDILPSLTLGLSGGGDGYSNSSSGSPVSSFSNYSSSGFKRERDQGGDQDQFKIGEDEDNEDHHGSPRKKLRLSKQQAAILELNFKDHSTLTPKQKHDLARQLNLRPRQVEVWFQNRRARTKLKQTEMDCELLKKCCENLKQENTRLQKELQELKSLKLTPPPFCMQLQAATLAVCPSCERTICGGGSGGEASPATTFPIGPEPYFLKFPFNHPSAAC